MHWSVLAGTGLLLTAGSVVAGPAAPGFDQRLRDGRSEQSEATSTARPRSVNHATGVARKVVANNPPPLPPGPPLRELDLAQVPLERAVGVAPNVLVVMDDSASMDWTIVTAEIDGRFTLGSGPVGQPQAVGGMETRFGYLFPRALPWMPSQQVGAGKVLPSQAAVDGAAELRGNLWGVWRMRSSRGNFLYYNPRIDYRPWVGLSPRGDRWPAAEPIRAALDPRTFDPGDPSTFIDLTRPISYRSTGVPVMSGATGEGTGLAPAGAASACRSVCGTTLTSRDYYIPRYYTSTDPGPLRHDSQQTLVEIRDGADAATGSAMFPGGPQRLDCAVDDHNPETCTYAQELQNFANWFSYYRSRGHAAKASLGAVLAAAPRLRVGYAPVNSADNRRRIAALNHSWRAGAKKALLDGVYAGKFDGDKALRGALRGAGRCLRCAAGDIFGSTTERPPGTADCPQLAAPEGRCQASFILLVTDGPWADSSYRADNHDGPGDGDTDFDGGVFADPYDSTLADVAMFIYERDAFAALGDAVPTRPRDLRYAAPAAFGDSPDTMHQHVRTYVVGPAFGGRLTAAQMPPGYRRRALVPRWPDPGASRSARIDDLRHAALNGRGRYLAASDPASLLGALQEAFDQFAAASPTSATSATSVSSISGHAAAPTGDRVHYRTTFNLANQSGDVAAYSLPAGGPLAGEPLWSAADRLDRQPPARRVIVTASRDANRGGYTGTLFTPETVDRFHRQTLDDDQIRYLRGDRSQEQPAGPLRQRPLRAGMLGTVAHSVPVHVGRPGGGRRTGTGGRADAAYPAFVAAHETRRKMLYVGANDGMVHGFDAVTGDELIAYIPNKLIDGRESHRNALSQFTLPAYRQGYFLDLTPTVADVYMRPRREALRRSWNTVLIGGCRSGCKGYFLLNVTDPGAFDADSAAGVVLWEFTDTDDHPTTGSAGGGRVDAGAEPSLDRGGEPTRDLGYGFSEPALLMSNVVEADGRKWVAAFGNGYNSTAGIAKLFVLFVDAGLDGWQQGDFVKISTGVGAAAEPDPLAGVPNGLGTPSFIDRDRNGTVDLAYAGDLRGNLYRFDLSSADPTAWRAVRLFTAARRAAGGGKPRSQPITQRPLVRKHPTEPDGFMVVFATGSYLTNGDRVSDQVQSVYGIWDRLEPGTDIATATPDARQTKLVAQGLRRLAPGPDQAGRFRRILSANPVNYAAAAGRARRYGWYFDLGVPAPAMDSRAATGAGSWVRSGFPGERAVRRMYTRGNTVVATTVIPAAGDPCALPPAGALISFDLATGGNPSAPVLDFNGDGVIDMGDRIMVDGRPFTGSVELGRRRAAGGAGSPSGAAADPPLLDPAVVSDGNSDYLLVGESVVPMTNSVDSRTGRLSWRRLELIY